MQYPSWRLLWKTYFDPGTTCTYCYPISYRDISQCCKTLSGCTPYQKAIFAQYAGAKSVIFVQHDGMKPVQIVVPAYSTQAPTAGLVLKIPLVMIAGESGSEIVNLLGQLNPSADSLRLRLVLSSKCLAPEYSHLYANNFAARSIEEETREALAGYITFHIAKTQGSFEVGLSIRWSLAVETQNL